MSKNYKYGQKNKKNINTKENNYNNSEKSNRNSKKRNYSQKKLFEFKKIEFPAPVCPKCGQTIKDITSAISDKNTGNPVHFDCVIDFLKKSETLNESEEVIYIGAGNFAVVYFENPKIRKNFKIIKLIEWENKNQANEWKSEIAELASKV